MPGTRQEIHKETNNCYATEAMQLAIQDLEDHGGAFVRVLEKDVPIDEVCNVGMFFYTVKHKHLESGHTKTYAYIDNWRRLDARFVVKGFQEAIGAIASVPKSQLGV